MWFLPCLFMAKLLYALLQNMRSPFLLSVLLGFLGLFLIQKGCFLPWCIELSLIVLPLIYVGNNFYLTFFKHLSNRKTIILALIGLCGLLISLRYSIHLNMQGHVIPIYEFYLISISGFLMVSGFCKVIQCVPFNDAISFWGRNSLLIMCLHEPIKRIVIKIVSVVLNRDIEVVRHDILFSLIVLLCLVAILLPLILIVNRYLNWTLGKIRKV